MLALDALYQRIKEAEQRAKLCLERWREDVSREIWTWQQQLPHVPLDALEKIAIERRVNMMDPEFSFQRAVFPEKPR